MEGYHGYRENHDTDPLTGFVNIPFKNHFLKTRPAILIIKALGSDKFIHCFLAVFSQSTLYTKEITRKETHFIPINL